MQVNDVGLLKLTKPRDVRPRIGDVDLNQSLTLEVKMQEDDKPLPQEAPLLAPLAPQSDDGQAVGLLVAHQHLRLHTVVVQCVHQAVGSHGSPTRPFACIDD